MNIYRTDRDSRKGGGVALYANSLLPITTLSVPPFSLLDDSLWCELSLPSSSSIIGVVYRPPSSPFHRDLLLVDILHHICSSNFSNILIMGDLNMDTRSSSSFLAHTFRHLSLTDHILFPTRFRQAQSPSKLDCIFTNDQCTLSNLHSFAPLGRSDHLVLSFTCSFPAPILRPHLSTSFLNYRKADFTKLSALLFTIDWHSVLPSDDIDKCWSSFLQLIRPLISLTVPISTIKSRRLSFNPSLSNRSLRLLRLKRAAWNSYAISRDSASYSYYKSVVRSCHSSVSRDRAYFQSSTANKILSNPKVFYNLVSKLNPTSCSLGPLKHNDSVLSDPSSIANLLADQFASSFSSSTLPTYSLPSSPASPSTIPPLIITEELVLKKLFRISQSKSSCCDDLPPILLRNCAPAFSVPLSIIFSYSLRLQSFPGAWKCGIITPIHKSGPKSVPSNYRPITQLPSVSKIFESILSDHLKLLLSSINFIIPQQHGFRSMHSTQTNLITALDDWTMALDQGLHTDVIYIDVSKAFDHVNHSVLLNKLTLIGLSPSIINLLRSYLSNRSFQVKVSNSFSRSFPVHSGVPQGSILGPLLFQIFINDVLLNTTSSSLIFADDIKIWRVINSPSDCLALQNDLNAISLNLNHIFLNINPLKCVHLPISRHKPPFHVYTLNGVPLSLSLVHSDLGTLISSNLNPRANSIKVCNKATKLVYLIKRVFGRLKPTPFLLIFKTLIRPILDFHMQAFPPSTKFQCGLFERVQRRATKLVRGLHSLNYSSRLLTLNLHSLAYRRFRGDLLFLKKIFLLPNHPCKHLLNTSDLLHLRRHSECLKHQWARTKARTSSFFVRTVGPWNSLPQDIISSSSLPVFKHNLDSHFLHISFSDSMLST